MKSSTVLASLLFGAFAAAAPVDKRALAYKTEVVTETVVIYTTVYDEDPVPTTLQGLFYEQPQATTTADVQPTSAPAPASSAAPKVEEPASVYTPPVVETPAPAPTPTPAAAPVVEQPKVEAQPTTEQAAAPAPAATSAAPAPAPATGGTTTGETFTNVDITIYDNNGAKGACGTDLYDTDMIVALAQPAWGASTYDVMTGEATNPWCGQKIQIEYEGNSIQATIMDLCPGCAGHDIDLSLAAWKALTGKDEKTRLKASWSKIA
ncbi:hypothetical protein IQ07DRAFT_88989 [Pyrenochaeta sp. DS3sAY3a]|nr:hypothetical protein IQ07DRAFT_88989 [Pyrenochaeta sp. DS3sAY3a]